MTPTEQIKAIRAAVEKRRKGTPRIFTGKELGDCPRVFLDTLTDYQDMEAQIRAVLSEEGRK